MHRKLKFSTNAEKSFDKIIKYLFREFSSKLENDFKEKFDLSIKSIMLFPESFPKTNYRQKYYKCVVSKQTTIFYKAIYSL